MKNEHKVIKMLKKNILAITLCLILSACASEKPVLNGVDGNAIPLAFAHFPDVPFPDKAYIDLNNTRALGSGENWIGSLTYTSSYEPSQIFDFYMSEMPKFKWIEVATVRARVSHMTYIRDNRALQILIEDGSDTVVTITAIPNTNVIGK